MRIRQKKGVNGIARDGMCRQGSGPARKTPNDCGLLKSTCLYSANRQRRDECVGHELSPQKCIPYTTSNKGLTQTQRGALSLSVLWCHPRALCMGTEPYNKHSNHFSNATHTTGFTAELWVAYTVIEMQMLCFLILEIQYLSQTKSKK